MEFSLKAKKPKSAMRPIFGFRERFEIPCFRNGGFTLIELIAVVACVSLLAVLCVGATQSALSSGNKVREINAARNLMAAYSSAAADGNGRYLPGMDYRVNASSNPVFKPDGTKVANSHAAQRFPFRLQPYLGDQFEGSILVNKNTKQIRRMAQTTPAMYDYIVSTYPALGLNIYGVGGVVLNNGTVVFDSDCISTVGKMKGSILAFASAGQGTGSNKKDGYCYVSPPTLTRDSPVCQAWGSNGAWQQSSDPMAYGFVDFRYDGKAVCAFLDGSVRMCSVEELNDMRVWMASAADQNDPNYQLLP